MKLGKALLSMMTSFAAGILLGALFVNKKECKTPAKEEQTKKSKSG
jgi:hypothetical protein